MTVLKMCKAPHHSMFTRICLLVITHASWCHNSRSYKWKSRNWFPFMAGKHTPQHSHSHYPSVHITWFLQQCHQRRRRRDWPQTTTKRQQDGTHTQLPELELVCVCVHFVYCPLACFEGQVEESGKGTVRERKESKAEWGLDEGRKEDRER